jgi:hypothetical protein
MRQAQLGLLICLPRTGSTMLADCLGLHSEVYCPPEPHLLYPMFHLGYFRQAYNEEIAPGPATHALCTMVNELPNGAEDYLEAIRAYADTIYGKLLVKSGKRVFVDKSPTYTDGGYLPLIERLYPDARYFVLVRNPIDVALSMYKVGSLWGWGEGSTKVWRVLRRIKEGFESLASFIARRPDAVVVRYEDLVREPDASLKRVCEHLHVEFEPAMMQRQRYVGEYWHGLGDPKSVVHRPPIGERPSTAQAAPNAMNKFYESQLLSGLGAIDPKACDVFGYSLEQLNESARRHKRA